MIDTDRASDPERVSSILPRVLDDLAARYRRASRPGGPMTDATDAESLRPLHAALPRLIPFGPLRLHRLPVPEAFPHVAYECEALNLRVPVTPPYPDETLGPELVANRVAGVRQQVAGYLRHLAATEA
jgi:hypothetical protein